VISTFNICSQIPTHRSLTDTNGGYHLGGISFPHHSHRSSQLTVLRFPLMALFGLYLPSQVTSSNIRWKTYTQYVVSLPLGIYRWLCLYLAFANGLQLLTRYPRINYKLIANGLHLMQLWYQNNFYRLNSQTSLLQNIDLNKNSRNIGGMHRGLRFVALACACSAWISGSSSTWMWSSVCINEPWLEWCNHDIFKCMECTKQ
jgi:hypothetical protein